MLGNKSSIFINKFNCNGSYLWPKSTLTSYQGGSLANNSRIGRVNISGEDVTVNEDNICIKGINDYTFDLKNIVEESNEYIVYENDYFYVKLIKK